MCFSLKKIWRDEVVGGGPDFVSFFLGKWIEWGK